MLRHVYAEKHNEVVSYKITAIGTATNADWHRDSVPETDILWAVLLWMMCLQSCEQRKSS